MFDRATRSSTDQTVMASDMPGNAAYRRTF